MSLGSKGLYSWSSSCSREHSCHCSLLEPIQGTAGAGGVGEPESWRAGGRTQLPCASECLIRPFLGNPTLLEGLATPVLQFLNGVVEGSMEVDRSYRILSTKMQRRRGLQAQVKERPLLIHRHAVDPRHPPLPTTALCPGAYPRGPAMCPFLCPSSYPEGSPAGPSASPCCPSVTCLSFQYANVSEGPGSGSDQYSQHDPQSALSPSPGSLLTPSPALLTLLSWRPPLF